MHLRTVTKWKNERWSLFQDYHQNNVRGMRNQIAPGSRTGYWFLIRTFVTSHSVSSQIMYCLFKSRRSPLGFSQRFLPGLKTQKIHRLCTFRRHPNGITLPISSGGPPQRRPVRTPTGITEVEPIMGTHEFVLGTPIFVLRLTQYYSSPSKMLREPGTDMDTPPTF